MISSCFKRAKHTAEIIHGLLGCAEPLKIDDSLNERDFGPYDLKDTSTIPFETWDDNVTDAVTNQHGIESVMNVLRRTSKLVKQLEDTYTNKNIILVSHGAPLQILLTTFTHIDPGQYTSVRHFDNAEIRELTDPNVLDTCTK